MISITRLLHGAEVGIFGGLLATAVMLWVEQALHRIPTRTLAVVALPDISEGMETVPPEPPPIQLATLIARIAFHYTIPQDKKEEASLLMQYIFGGLFAAGYCAVALFLPWVTLGWGAVLGIALWLGGDGLVAPLLGVADWPTHVPRRVLVINLTTHLLYGLVTETVRVLLHA